MIRAITMGTVTTVTSDTTMTRIAKKPPASAGGVSLSWLLALRATHPRNSYIPLFAGYCYVLMNDQ